jgi:uracil-DNA glycosylase
MLSLTNYNYKSWKDKYYNYDTDTYSKKLSILDTYIDSSWNETIDLLDKDTLTNINDTIEMSLLSEKQVFPYPDLVFNTFNMTDYDNIKVVILGQDPYFSMRQKPEAMGLSFSVPQGIPIPSSLSNIYKNAKEYGHMFTKPTHGNLEFWANQGVLMLNAALTVEEKKPNSHAPCWHNFTDKIIKKLSDDKENLVFVLWGAFAAKKRKLIDNNSHHIIITSHPSGLSCNTPYEGKAFSRYDHFKEINSYLKKTTGEQIIWQII